MHLAIDSAQRAVRIENDRRVVINPRRAFLEKRCHQNDFVLTRGGGEFLCTRTRNRLGKIEERSILTLTEILRLKKLRQTHDVRAAFGRVRNAIERLG